MLAKKVKIKFLLDKVKGLYDQEKYEEAISFLNKVLDIDSNNFYALGNKGVVLAIQEKHDEAIAY